jgi:hypothetical protein
MRIVHIFKSITGNKGSDCVQSTNNEIGFSPADFNFIVTKLLRIIAFCIFVSVSLLKVTTFF